MERLAESWPTGERLKKMRTGIFRSTFIAICFQMAMVSLSQAKEVFSADDVFKIAYASNPVLSPDGQTIAFHRYFMDIMTDHRRNDLWVIQSDGESLRQISQGFDAVGAMAFTQSNKAIAFVAYQGDKSHLYLQQLDSGERIELGEALIEPANLAFSPDGKWLAFTMPVNHDHETLGEPLTPPEGAQWAEPIIVETRSQFRVDGVGYLPPARQQLFLLPTAGGKAEQVTQSTFAIDSPIEWLPDSSGLLFSANIKSNVNKPWDTDVVRFDLRTGRLTALTSQTGPDQMPSISPDGKRLAWMGHADQPSIYHEYQLYTANVDGSEVETVPLNSDYGVVDFAWHPDSKRYYVQYEERGRSVLALLSGDGAVSKLSDQLAGWELDQPYVLGQFSTRAGVVAVTVGDATRPTELGVIGPDGLVKTITDFSRALLDSVHFVPATEHAASSSVDQRDIQYWMMVPPNFDPARSYPMILQIHGGPWASYGPQFAANNQLYAAAGYVVVFGNPRGSTGYDAEFAHEIDNNFPSHDYDDLMDIVDGVVSRGFVDDQRLYVVGGSGGGTLTAWIVGKTNRFRAAVAVNPAINWLSIVLTADLDKLMANYWFKELPWENPMKYWSHSPLSLVGNVTTPTMLMTGENDWRTPIWEAEQYFNALQIQGVETALVRVPGAGHWIEYRPSQLVAKVNAVLAWFERFSDVPTLAGDE